MSLLINRSGIDMDVLEQLRSHLLVPEFGHEGFGAEDLAPEGQEILRSQMVEGSPADGVRLHNTRAGRVFCAYVVVD